MPRSDYSLSITDGHVTPPRSALAFSPVFGEVPLPLLLVYRVSKPPGFREIHNSRSGRTGVSAGLGAAEGREQPSTRAMLVSSVAVLSSRRSLFFYGGI